MFTTVRICNGTRPRIRRSDPATRLRFRAASFKPIGTGVSPPAGGVTRCVSNRESPSHQSENPQRLDGPTIPRRACLPDHHRRPVRLDSGLCYAGVWRGAVLGLGADSDLRIRNVWTGPQSPVGHVCQTTIVVLCASILVFATLAFGAVRFWALGPIPI